MKEKHKSDCSVHNEPAFPAGECDCKYMERVEIKEGQFKIDEIEKGQIQKWGNRWYFACPRCGNCLGLDHKVEINDNKEVTIEPSVGCPQCRLHIFVRKGKIEYLSDI